MKTETNSKKMSRRRFLGATSAWCVSGMAAASGSPSPPALTDSVRIGVIGCGVRGRALLDCIAGMRAARPVVVADTNAERRAWAADRYAVCVERDWRRVAEHPGVDAVVVATPDYLHSEMAAAALTAGKDVYCETPFCHTFREAVRLRSAASANGRVVQAGAHEIADPRWHALREILREGRLGNLVWCQVFQYCDAPAAGWRTCARSGAGPALETQYGALAALTWAAAPGRPNRVSVMGGTPSVDGLDTPDSLLTEVEYEGGPTVVLVTAGTGAAPLPTVLRGSRGTATLLPDGIEIDGEAPVKVSFPELPLTAHVRDWIEAIRTRRACAADPALACAVQSVVDAAGEAWRRNAAIVPETAREPGAIC